jgi:hypothetical protein
MNRYIELTEAEIKAAIREYVSRIEGVNVEQVGVALQATRRGWFLQRADFTAPITLVDSER